MTRVVFENATIRDVIGKAARVAPTKGSAFDKAAGILIEANDQSNEVIVRATNLEVFYMEVTEPVSIEGGSVKWLIPSMLLDGIVNKLPITSGSQVAFDDEGTNRITIATGRMRAKLQVMDYSYYPQWSAFDPSELTAVEHFAARLQQVQWAASTAGVVPLTGIHLDGEHAMATDQFRIGLTPCPIPQLLQPVTIPATIFGPLMKNLGEVSVGQETGHLLVMPDDATQIRAVLFEAKYPPIKKVLKRDETSAFFCPKEALTDMIDRAMVMGQRDRDPMLKVIIGEEEVAMMMEDREMGLLGDVIELPGQATHARHYIGFTPDNLKSALNSSPNKDVSVYYHPGQPMKPVRIDGGSGYEALVMPRNLEKSQ